MRFEDPQKGIDFPQTRHRLMRLGQPPRQRVAHRCITQRHVEIGFFPLQLVCHGGCLVVIASEQMRERYCSSNGGH